MYSSIGCEFCGGEPFHRITCPMLRKLVLLGFLAPITSFVLVVVLSALGIGFQGLDLVWAAILALVGTVGLLIYQLAYRRRQ